MVYAVVNSVSCITLVWQSLWRSIPSRASLWCGSLCGGQFRIVHHSGVAVSVVVNSVSCITLVWQSLWWSIPSRASLWCGSLSGGQFRLVHPSGVAVSGPLAAREGGGLRIICRFMFSVVLLLSQLCGSYLFSSSGARMIHQPPMTSIVGGCLPAVCVDAHNLHVMFAGVFVSLTRR